LKINRQGTDRNEGTTYVDLQEPRMSWNSATTSLSISADRVLDFSTRANHDYDISLSLEEFSKLLDTLGDAAVTEPAGTLAASLAPSLRALLRLMVVCAGPFAPVVRETSQLK
jgi:hypothetical protein